MKRFLILFYGFGLLVAHGQNSSALSSGKWFKLAVSYDAVYKVDYNLLKAMGLNPEQIDPGKIQVFAGVNTMLPQSNQAARINDLKELSIFISGADDGKFNTGDYLLFYGQGPDGYDLPIDRGIFHYENNLFTDFNYYFLTLGSNNGKRMTSQENITGTFPIVGEFDDLAYYETEQYNELHSGREWFGEQFDSRTEYTIRFEVPGIVDGSSIELISDVMGQSFGESSFQLYFNNILIGEQKIQPIFDTPYASTGNDRTDTLTVSAVTVNASAKTNQDVRLEFVKASSGRSVGYLDHLLLQTKRKLALYGEQTIFHSLKSLEQPVSLFSVANMPAAGVIWNITDPFNPQIQQHSFDSGDATFGAASGSLGKYIIISNHNYPAPKLVGAVMNQNLHGLTSLDLLIVTAPEFLAEAQRLAAFRQQKNSIMAAVVTTTQVYNEFSGGKQDVTAIRDVVKYFYDQKTGIKNLLLFGRGSYDYRNYLPYNKNFVPTYESRNSLSPLETYSSDDYFGFLEATEGNWGENPPETHTLDIGVGRLPVKKIDEAKIIVDKLIQYENQNWGDWRKELLFVADDGDFNIHQGQAELLAEGIETQHPEFNVQKIYIDAFKQVKSSIGQVSPEATTALSDAVRAGVAVVNYTGHGGEQQWMQERIFDQVSLSKWKTGPHYPFLVTATCEFGRNDDPGLISTAELSLVNKDGGSIGLVTTARPVNSSTNFTLNTAFYQALFAKKQNRFRELGAVFLETKNTSISGVANRNFTLLGDPSMTLALPNPELKVTAIKNLTSGSDTLKALSSLKITGAVYENGLPVTDYKGKLAASLFGKIVKETTNGDENTPFDYLAHDNILFHGQASIENGQFGFELTVPKSIDPIVGTGKLSLYASSATGKIDVTGVATQLMIGSIEKNPAVDTSGPDISLFMGDTTFINGGIAGTDSRIVAILSDESGINISSYVPENNLAATLDDSVTFTLNKYYQSDIDQATRGKVNYPVDGLKPGLHHLQFRASDTFNNQSTGSITFYVSDESGIQIENLMNYPNPFSSSTTLHFKHNRSGEDLEAVVIVYNLTGQPLISTTYQVTQSAYQVDLPAWDGTTADGTKLSNGLYLLKLSLRSLLDGSKNEKITKVIITN